MIPSAASSLPMSSDVDPSGTTSGLRLTGTARRVDLSLHPHRAGAGRQGEHDEQHDPDQDEAPATRRVAADLDVLLLDVVVLVVLVVVRIRVLVAVAVVVLVLVAGSASGSSSARAGDGRSSILFLGGGGEAPVVEPGLQHDRGGHLVDNSAASLGVEVEGLEITIRGDGGQALVPQLHRQAGRRLELAGLGPGGGRRRSIGAVERQREPDDEELGAGVGRQVGDARDGRGHGRRSASTTS